MLTFPHSSLADVGRLDKDDDWDFGDLLTCGAPDPRSALKPDLDGLGVACKQAGDPKPAKMVDIVAVAKAGLTLRQELPLQVSLINSQAEGVSVLSSQCTSLGRYNHQTPVLIYSATRRARRFADPIG